MIIKTKKTRKRVIDLDGPEGNAYMLLGYARRFAQEMHLDGDAISAEMRAGDYKHLVATFDRHFGGIIDLSTEQSDLLEACRG